MSLQAILPFTRSLLQEVVDRGDTVVDATMGNGLDTLFLATLVGKDGTVFAYDIQEEAIQKTKERLIREGQLTQAQLLLKGHETMEEELSQLTKPISAAMFNLGYRPGGDKEIVTYPKSTIQALHILSRYLKKDGIITLVVYSGHEQGKAEKTALLDEIRAWDQSLYSILKYEFINQLNHPPFLIAIQKK
ncbi:tRNA (mnm(5)s(2)U34)-methyltransferase [Caldalkalibacillus mannanilyticus]|uniref:tRNA (mnm(5)s(2)U34)-methyltransferase n=1 Tax=Caldalkalibacillus mannanilyticus TaxID=1418 RepID=UPI0004684B16|nr:class I SAM-dependent methyltransferase [Caldalkalibacillus mannanilyticus]